MTDVSGNVEAISTYTIGPSGTITLETFNIFAAMAATQIAIDDPSSLLASEQSNVAQAMYVCHLIAQKKGQVGKTSLSIGKYSYSKVLASGMTSWLDSYQSFIKGVQSAPVDLTSSDYTYGFTRDDATMNGLALDQSTPYDLDDEVNAE
jgi:hypothetical protein